MYELPKKYKRTEAKVDGPILEWLSKHHPRSFALEVKIAGGVLLEHQDKALKQVSKGLFTHKIPDMGGKNPFDAFCLKDADAIVCVADGKNVECSVNSAHTIRFSLSKKKASKEA